MECTALRDGHPAPLNSTACRPAERTAGQSTAATQLTAPLLTFLLGSSKRTWPVAQEEPARQRRHHIMSCQQSCQGCMSLLVPQKRGLQGLDPWAPWLHMPPDFHAAGHKVVSSCCDGWAQSVPARCRFDVAVPSKLAVLSLSSVMSPKRHHCLAPPCATHCVCSHDSHRLYRAYHKAITSPGVGACWPNFTAVRRTAVEHMTGCQAAATCQSY